MEILTNLEGPGPVHFYEPDGYYGWLSTYAKYPIVIDGVAWNTVEHFYQASKFTDDHIRGAIRSAATPSAAKRIAVEYKDRRIPTWPSIKNSAMLAALRCKFAQYPELRRRLVGTGSAEIIEMSPDDWYWGAGCDGGGKNVLGQLIMSVRDEISREPSSE